MMKKTIREKLWWPGIDRMVEEFSKSCMGCVAMSKADPPEPMCRSEMPERPWQSLGIDYLEVPECGTEFLVVVDYYSRYLAVRAVKEANARNTINALADIFNQWAFPEKLRLDNGQPFASKEFAEYAKSKNVQLEFAILYWPQMNGAVERQSAENRKSGTEEMGGGHERLCVRLQHQTKLRYRQSAAGDHDGSHGQGHASFDKVLKSGG